MTRPSTAQMREEITHLATRFRLPTVSKELVGRLAEAGGDDALQIVHEVFVAEEDDRRERRVQRLR